MYSVLRRVLLLALAFMAANAVEAATVTTPPPPNISSQPKPLIVTAGSSATFSVTAKGNSALKYQWQIGGGNISGATKSTYTIVKTTLNSTGTYDVVVSQTVNSVTSSNTSTGALLTVNPNFAGKFNLAIIGYNASLVNAVGGTNITGGNASGGAHYGTATVTSVAGVSSLAGSLTKYLGPLPSPPISIAGMVSTNGTVTLTDSGSNLTTNMVQYNGTTIGIFGTGTTPGGTGANDTLILGLNATTTAPASIKACAGNYTMIVISYNATAVSKGNANENDGDAEIAHVTVSSNGSVSISDVEYATGGDNTLGGAPNIFTGTVSSSGVLTVNDRSGTDIKFVALNGQVIGIAGTIKPSSGHSNSGFLLGIRGSFTPL